MHCSALAATARRRRRRCHPPTPRPCPHLASRPGAAPPQTRNCRLPPCTRRGCRRCSAGRWWNRGPRRTTRRGCEGWRGSHGTAASAAVRGGGGGSSAGRGGVEGRRAEQVELRSPHCKARGNDGLHSSACLHLSYAGDCASQCTPVLTHHTVQAVLVSPSLYVPTGQGRQVENPAGQHGRAQQQYGSR